MIRRLYSSMVESMTRPRNLPSAACASCAALDGSSPLVPMSRSAGLLSQAGNADCEVKTRLAEEVRDDFRKLARSLGMNDSEMLRILVLTRLYGVEGVARMTAEQLAAVAGVVPQTDQREAQR